MSYLAMTYGINIALNNNYMTIYIRTQLEDEYVVSITSDIVPRVGERVTVIDEHTNDVKDYIVKSVDYTYNISRFSEYLQRITIYV